ncbi:hypothetical protein [Devosia chinhatensis]|nr:hypothetical protein [Devosia chinhatensis]
MPDYLTLYAEAERLGFTDVIVADDGRLYKMPPGEYDIVSPLNAFAVRELAQMAASATGRNNAVLVTEAGIRTWFNLLPLN